MGYFFAIISHTESFSSTHPSSRWSYSCCSTSASIVNSGSSRNKDDTISGKDFLAFLSTNKTFADSVLSLVW